VFANICPAVFSMMAQQGSTLRLTAEGVSELAMRNITGTFSSGRIADVAVEDPVNANLLFIGTEFGLSFTVDGGRHRVKLKGGNADHNDSRFGDSGA
jgi:hypothetical protein